MKALAAVLVAVAMLASSAATALTEVTGFGTNPGNLKMFKYVPPGLPANAPLVVALHGCAQSAAAYDAETGWQMLADRWHFALLLPQQQSANNATSCFNFFEPGDMQRGQGEALSIRQMVDRMRTDHAGDAARVYVTGLSAGGAMTAVMLATYPDVFAGGAIVAGLPYGCANGMTAAFSCMNPGSDLTPAQWGTKVRAASSWTGPWPVVSIWHGDADTTVRPVNATESAEQWTHVHGIDLVPDVADTIAGYPHKVYKDASGRARVETVLVTGMGHGTPVDPGNGETQCGTAGAYILDANVCSSYWIARFWGLDDLDGTPPQVTLTAPANGATVGGSVTLAANASDDVAIARVEFLVDGALVASDTAAPYTATWNASAAANGTHTLTARAVDTAGNTATSAAVAVTVSGGIADTTPPAVALVFPPDGATLSGSVTLSADASDDVGVTDVTFLLDGAVLGAGNRAGQAGPWTFDWNTTSASAGGHAIGVRASDASGNVTAAAPRLVTVSRDVPTLDERFSDRDASGDHYDSVGWSGDFVADAANATAGPGASRSAFGAASSGTGCQVGTKTKFLARSITLGASPRLSYARRLDLKANANSSYRAYFRVTVDGATVDEHVVTYSAYADALWQRRENLDLAAYANRTVTLRFEVGATANVCLEAWARAGVDDVMIANAVRDADSTPPAANLTAPANGATVSGSVAVTADASDANGVTKVEFYANGTLLGTDMDAPFGLTWNTAGLAPGSYALMVKAYDPAGNVGTDADTDVTLGGGGGTVQRLVFDNEDANDGYVKASADGMGAAAGTLETLGLALGRGTDGKFNRAVLSFDTSALPDGATVTGAVLTVAWRSASGDPWNDPVGNTLVVDVNTGCYGACTIAATDWSAAGAASAVATIARFASGTQNSTAFDASGLAALHRTGRTQLRLRFAQNAAATNYVWIGNGTSAKLTVDYVP
jgi:poly(hydroxyalkanoate) depolymerase family esterase